MSVINGEVKNWAVMSSEVKKWAVMSDEVKKWAVMSSEVKKKGAKRLTPWFQVCLQNTERGLAMMRGTQEWGSREISQQVLRGV